MPRKERERWLLLSFPLLLLLFQFMEVYIAQGVCTPFSSCFFFLLSSLSFKVNAFPKHSVATKAVHWSVLFFFFT